MQESGRMGDGTERAAMVESLRGQIVERVKAQQQIIVVSAAVAGATISFASNVLSGHPEIMALLCLLYVGLSLALLRQDQEITIIAVHLLDPSSYGDDARAQARWEVHKFHAMQGNVAGLVQSTAQAVGIYGVPILSGLFLFGAADVARRYRELGEIGGKVLNTADATRCK